MPINSHIHTVSINKYLHTLHYVTLRYVSLHLCIYSSSMHNVIYYVVSFIPTNSSWEHVLRVHKKCRRVSTWPKGQPFLGGWGWGNHQILGSNTKSWRCGMIENHQKSRKWFCCAKDGDEWGLLNHPKWGFRVQSGGFEHQRFMGV